MILAPFFLCAALSVHDGDGPIRCASGERIRLAGIAAREINGTCSAGHPCPRASAAAAKRQLERLVVGRTLRCERVGTSYGRVVAFCTVGGVDVSCAMVRSGTVLRWARYDRGGRLARCR